MVRQIEMGDGVELKDSSHLLMVCVQEILGPSRPGIGDQKANVEVTGSLDQWPDEVLLSQVQTQRSIVDARASVSWLPIASRSATRRATSTRFNPLAASCRANSLPMPEDAPVTTAHGPNLCLSMSTKRVLLIHTYRAAEAGRWLP